MTMLRDAYRQKLEAAVEEMAARLKIAKAKAKGLAADAKIAAHEELAATEKKLTELQARLDRLQSSGGAAWKDVKTGVEDALSDLNTAARRAIKHFGKTPPARTRK